LVLLPLLSFLQIFIALVLPSLSYPWAWAIVTLIFPSFSFPQSWVTSCLNPFFKLKLLPTLVFLFLSSNSSYYLP
jgi:hypothetical protein